MFISFIIPVYNISNQLLRRCLESITNVAVEKAKRELIVVDDGSEIPVQIDLPGENIRVVRQTNAGAAAARNAGIELAKGEYIQFIDADDYILPDIYNNVINMLELRNPDVLALGFYYGKRNKKPAGNLDGDDCSGAQYMADNNILGIPWAYVFRRDIMGNLRFRVGSLHEDEEFVPLLLLRAKKMAVTDLKPYFYEKRQGSAVNDFDSNTVNKRLNDFFNIICRHARTANKLRSGEDTDGIQATKLAAKAMQRRTDQLSMDYIVNVVRLRGMEKNGLSKLQRFKYVWRELKKETKKMRAEGVFPLPCKYYTFKYTVFRVFTKFFL